MRIISSDLTLIQLKFHPHDMTIPGCGCWEVCSAELHKIVNITTTFTPQVTERQVSELPSLALHYPQQLQSSVHFSTPISLKEDCFGLLSIMNFSCDESLWFAETALKRWGRILWRVSEFEVCTICVEQRCMLTSGVELEYTDNQNNLKWTYLYLWYNMM